MHSQEDAIAELGFIALGTRLKRLAEQLQAGVAEALSESGFEILPGQLPVLLAIGDEGGRNIAELASLLGVAQPGISRTLGTLQRAGLVTLERDKEDARTRRVYLTNGARALLLVLHGSLFGKVGAAAAELCKGLNLLEMLGIMEARNREIPFADRIRKAVA